MTISDPSIFIFEHKKIKISNIFELWALFNILYSWTIKKSKFENDC